MLSKLTIIIIKIYQKCLSPFLGPRCCFYPTCSEYAIQSFKEFGFIKGLYLSIKRISRCHPYSTPCIDHIPQK
ncbi:MAG: membrane protein insertion efficiency factor YidD [Rickettsiales bacterium]|nr:membrane protein insertion efficiency factor YidD [Rickettsiales bacterium]